MITRIAALVPALAGAAACGGTEVRPREGAQALATVEVVRRVELELPGVTGLSDLSEATDGALWAVAERKRFAVRIAPDGATSAVPIHGVPERIDIEGLAWLGDGRVALATESDQARRPADALLFARVGPDGVRVEEERRLEYRMWPLDSLGNQGVEGLCRAGGALALAVETVMARGAERHAPIALHDLETGAWTALRVRLTTRTGKLSALACRERAGGVLDVLAIERHFEVARLIRFAVPPDARSGDPPLEPVVVADLGPVLTRSENFEGLVWDGERTFSLVADNDWTHVTGPNLLLRARLLGAVPAPPALR